MTMPADPDRRVLDFVQGWPQAAGADACMDGVNLGRAVRRSLSIALSAAIRRDAFQELAARDDAFRERWRLGPAGADDGRPGQAAAAGAAIAAWARRQFSGKTRRPAGDRRRRVLMRASGRLGPLATALLDDPSTDLVLAGPAPFLRAPAPYRAITPGPATPRRRLARFEAALAGALETAGLELAASGRAEVLAEAGREHARAKAARRAFAELKPDVIVLHDDTAPDGLTWALVAADMGVPTVTLAHGLDCERFMLDAVHADRKCVWGPARVERIRAFDLGGVDRTRVIGHPGHDGLRPPDVPAGPNGAWLWATRPHAPRKCFTAGRFAIEGADIFRALLDALRQAPNARLTVKPHPSDYANIYRAMREMANDLRDRVTISDGGLEGLLPEAGVVIAEDTTAALDAALCGKPLVHAHFAPTPPVLPLATLGAALPGGDAASLRESLLTLTEGDAARQAAMFEGQRAFIDAYAGRLDGGATARAMEVIADPAG